MSKNRTSRTSSTSRRGHGAGTSGAFEVFRRPQRSTPALAAVVVWRWRWELTFTAVLIAVFVALTTTGLYFAVAVLIMLGVAVLILSLPVIRQWAVTRVMCVIIRHRLRVCLAEMRTLNYSGYLPLIVHVRGTPVGLVAYLWMRPGLSVTDLDNRTEHLATACWAREVRIQRSRRVAALVRVDIVRRDPLGASAPITSSLMASTADVPSAQPGGLPDTVLSGIVHPAATTTRTIAGFDTTTAEGDGDTGTESGSVATATATAVKPRKTTTKTTTTATTAMAPEGPAVVINGEDVSDYV